MPVEKILCLPTRYQDLSILTVTDESEYTTTPNARNSAARILLGAALGEEQELDWITDIVNSTPLTTLEWTMTSKGDGAYRFFYISIPKYDSAVTYNGEIKTGDVVTQYGNIIYHTPTGDYYKAKAQDFENIEPTVTSGWADYWDIYDIANIKDELLNDKIEVFIYDDVVTGAYEDCILAKADITAKAVLCDACSDEQWIRMEKMEFLLDATNSKNWQEKAIQASIILKQADKKFCC